MCGEGGEGRKKGTVWLGRAKVIQALMAPFWRESRRLVVAIVFWKEFLYPEANGVPWNVFLRGPPPSSYALMEFFAHDTERCTVFLFFMLGRSGYEFPSFMSNFKGPKLRTSNAGTR